MSESTSPVRPCLIVVLKEKWLWILSGITILYFYRPLFLNETFFFRDLHLIFYPQRLRLVKLLSAGELPLWDSYLRAGQPFLAEVNNAVLSPFLWLYWLLPFPLAFNVEIVMHVLLAGAGTYLLARVLGLSPISSVVAALVYAFCGYTLSFVNLAHRFLAIPYLPFLVAFWHLWLSESRNRWLLAAVVTATLQLFTGALEMSFISFCMILFWSFFFPYSSSLTAGKKIVRWIALLALTAGLGAVQLLPTAEMVTGSSRGTGYDYMTFGAWSLNPKRIPEMLVPRFFGFTDRLFLRDYWGAAIEGFHLPYVLSIYIGLPVLILATASLTTANSVVPLRARRFLAASFALAILFSIGKFLPFFHSVYETLPFLHQFRYPIKLFALATIPLSLLAASGADSLLGNQMVTHFSFRGRAVLWSLVVLMAIFTTSFAISEDFRSSFILFYFGSANARAGVPLQQSFLHVTAACLLAVILLEYRDAKPRKVQQYLFAGLIAADLLIAGRSVTHYAPESFLTTTPQIVSEVRKRIANGRFWREENPPNIVFNIPINNAVYLDRWNLETLYNYSGPLYDIKIAFHEDYDGLANQQIQELKNFVDNTPWERRLPVLSAAGVQLILSPQKLAQSGIRRLGAVRNNSNVLFYLYVNERAARPVEFVTSWRSTLSPDETIQAMSDESFDPRTAVILPGTASQKQSQCTGAGAIVRIISQASSRVNLKINTSCEGYLVFNEVLFPGWHVKVDGEEATVTRANHAFQAVFLRAGEHTVERYYLPASILCGATISALSCIALMIIVIKKREALPKH